MSQPLKNDRFYVLHVEDEEKSANAIRNRVAEVLASWKLTSDPNDWKPAPGDDGTMTSGRIVWTTATNAEAARARIDEMADRQPSFRGFDAALLDLKIPDSPGGELGWGGGSAGALQTDLDRWAGAA